MFSYKRSQRVGELMLEEISGIIKNEVKDPRIGFVTVTRVELTENLRFARVYVSPMGTEGQQLNTYKGICSAAPFIRSRLGKRIRIKFLPELVFKWDHSLEESDRISRMLHTLENGGVPAGSEDDS